MRDPAGIPLLTPERLLGAESPVQPPRRPLRFALAHRAEREHPTLVHECFERLGLPYDIERIPDVPLHVDLSLDMLPGITMAHGRMHGSRNRRTRVHVGDGTDDTILIVSLRGPHLVEQLGSELELGDGEAVLVSASDPSCFSHKAPGDMMVMRFAKAHIGPRLQGGRDGCMRRILRDTQTLGLLTDYLAIGRDRPAAARPDLQHLMAGHVYDLIAVMAGATRDAEEAAQAGGLRAARLHAIKQDIERYLDQADLSVVALAERHCCTPRQVQRLFEAEGSTFTEYVHGQRLGRAYRLLSDPLRHADKISAIALDCGFGDVSYFNRAFRRRYGVAPSDVRAQAQPAPPTLVRRDN